MTPRPHVIIDTDPGIDDAIAILMALAYSDWDLLGLTTVGGNVSAHQSTRNALALLEYAQATSIPLARGSSRPLEGRFANAHHFHGPTGLSHPLPLPETRPVPGGAVNFLAQQLLRGTSAVKIVALGPLTNIARLLRRYPAAAENISSLAVMGGAVGVPGNVTANAEFNFYCDPTAAAEVMASGISITLIDLGASRQAAINRAEGETVRSSHPLGWLAARLICQLVRPRHRPPGVPVLRPTGLGRCHPTPNPANSPGDLDRQYRPGPWRLHHRVRTRPRCPPRSGRRPGVFPPSQQPSRPESYRRRQPVTARRSRPFRLAQCGGTTT